MANKGKKRQKRSTPSPFKGFGGKNTISSAAERLGKQLRQDPKAAIQCLEALAAQYPDHPHPLEILAGAYEKFGFKHKYQQTLERLITLDPKRSDLHLILASAYLSDTNPALALQTLYKFRQDFPNSTHRSHVEALIAKIEPYMEDVLSTAPVAKSEHRLELAALMERVIIATKTYNFEAVCDFSHAALALEPEFVPALNNLSVAYWQLGDVERAQDAIDRVLAQEPDNVFALANRIQIWVLLGEEEQAQALKPHLLNAKRDRADHWPKTAEALAFLGDPETTVALYEQAEALPEVIEEGSALLDHYAAAAYSQLGQLARARQLWEKALKESPTLDLIKGNHEDSLLPARERQGPWALALESWLPFHYIQSFKELAASLSDHERLSEEDEQQWLEQREAIFAQLLSRFNFQALIPRILREGGPKVRELIGSLARLTDREELWALIKDYALSQDGPLRPRLRAAELAVKAGQLPKQLRLWCEEGWQELQILEFEVSDAIDIDPYTPQVMRLMQKALAKLWQDPEGAEALLLEAQGLMPEVSSIEYNLAVSYLLREREAEGRAILEALHERDPNYVPAPVQLARLETQAGNLEAASAWLKPLLERSHFHIDDFAVFCTAEVELAIAREQWSAASYWLSLWERTTPGHPDLLRLKRRVAFQES